LRYFSWRHNHMSQYMYFGKKQQDLQPMHKTYISQILLNFVFIMKIKQLIANLKQSTVTYNWQMTKEMLTEMLIMGWHLWEHFQCADYSLTWQEKVKIIWMVKWPSKVVVSSQGTELPMNSIPNTQYE
jgi:hypothetical protein